MDGEHGKEDINGYADLRIMDEGPTSTAVRRQVSRRSIFEAFDDSLYSISNQAA